MHTGHNEYTHTPIHPFRYTKHRVKGWRICVRANIEQIHGISRVKSRTDTIPTYFISGRVRTPDNYLLESECEWLVYMRRICLSIINLWLELKWKFFFVSSSSSALYYYFFSSICIWYWMLSMDNSLSSMGIVHIWKGYICIMQVCTVYSYQES